MKRITGFLIGLLCLQIGNGQVTKPGTKTVTKPVTAAEPFKLKTKADTLSYILGEISAFNLVNQGLGDVPINDAAFMHAIKDILGKKKTLIDDVTANTVLNNHMMSAQAEKAKVQIEKDQKFLDQNKLREGVKTTASGLQYEVITEGTGIKPAAEDTFVVHYRGTLVDGTEFDASYNRGQPLTYPMNKVIPGWTEALKLMGVGSKYKVYIPYHIGYGIMGQGQIPGGATLIFEMELLDVKKKSP